MQLQVQELQEALLTLYPLLGGQGALCVDLGSRVCSRVDLVSRSNLNAWGCVL